MKLVENKNVENFNAFMVMISKKIRRVFSENFKYEKVARISGLLTEKIVTHFHKAK
jgi:hypothetical protein